MKIEWKFAQGWIFVVLASLAVIWSVPTMILYGAKSYAPGEIINLDVQGNLTGGNIATSSIADGSITTPKLGDAAIDSQAILDLTILAADIASGAVTTAKVNDGSITTAKLSGGGRLITNDAAVCVLSPGVFGQCTTADASSCGCT